MFRVGPLALLLVAAAACGHADPCPALRETYTAAATRVACTADDECAAAPVARWDETVEAMGGPDAPCPGAARRDALADVRRTAAALRAQRCAAVSAEAPLACRGHRGAVACVSGECTATYSY